MSDADAVRPDLASVRLAIADAVMNTVGGARERLASDPAAHLQLLRVTVGACEETTRLLHAAVDGARHSGNSWDSIGAVLGVSRQAAQQRFGSGRVPTADLVTQDDAAPRRKVLSPVTAFDEMAALAEEGRHGWHSVDFGTLHHVLEASPWQWEHRRVLVAPLTHRTMEDDGWQRVKTMWFPWAYYTRCTDRPALAEASR